MEPEIQKAGISDAGIIQQLAQSIWPKTYGEILGNAQLDYMLNLFYSLNIIEEQISTGQQKYYILYEAQEPVGFISYEAYHEAATYKIQKLYIHPSTQGKGYGKKLLTFVRKKLKKQGVKFLVLNVNRYNAPAIAFYEKMGMERIQSVDVSIGKGYLMEDYVYRMDNG